MVEIKDKKASGVPIIDLDDSPGYGLDDPVVSEAKKRFDRCAEWESPSRERFIDDIKFENGDPDNGFQWPNAIRRTREVGQKPCLTINLIQQHNFQISNQARKNKSSVKFKPQGNGATIDSARMMSNIARRIENRSHAQEIYTLGRNFQIGGGIGWWRVRTDYCRPDSMDQDAWIDPILDPLSVYMDPDIKQKNGSDARFAFVFDDISKDLFDEMYPEFKDLVGGTNPMGVGGGDDWIAKDHVRICEYFRKVARDDEVVSFVWQGQRQTVLRSKLPSNIAKRVLADSLTKTRPTQIESIEWYLIAGTQVVDSTIWPGKFIPLVRCVGIEYVVDGVMDRKGHTRAMKDAQRMLNYNAALDINTSVPTLNGWTTQGLLRRGDWVFDAKGNPVQVAEALPIRVGERCFEVTFDTGASVVTDAGHIWQVEEKGKRTSRGLSWKTKTVSTEELSPKKHTILLAEPIQTLEATLPIDPYVLGLWLGDGNQDCARITAHVDDIEEQKVLVSGCGYTVGENSKPIGLGSTFNIFGIRHELKKLGLNEGKYIPQEYLRASYSQRLSLLQGLMDSDGCYHEPVHQCIFINNNKDIGRGFLELCSSLGLKVFVSKIGEQLKQFPSGNIYKSKECFRFQFTANPEVQVFRLSRKMLKQTAPRDVHKKRTDRIKIVSVREVESRPVRCITLGTPDHLYLCGEGMIPTHNSSQVEFVALQGKTPWVAPAEAIEELEAYWNTANTANHSVLPYKSINDEGNPIPPPQRTQPPTASPAYQMGMETAFNQIMMVSGQWQNQMGMMGNERTGAAINSRQRQSENSVFHFQDNYEVALTFTAEILLDLIPKIYDTKRVLMVQAENEEDIEIQVDPAARQAYQEEISNENLIVGRIFNPALGEYSISPSAGPAYGSKLEQTTEALTLILTQAPQLVPIIGDLVLSSMDFDKAQEAAQRLRRLVPPQALGTGPSQQEIQLGQQNQALQSNLSESLQKQGELELKLVGKAQMRDIDTYKAQTDRMKALQDQLPLDPDGIMELLRQLVNDAMQSQLAPIMKANQDDLDIDGPGNSSTGGSSEAPPLPGAKRALDGQWYVPHPAASGRFLKVVPNGSARRH